MQNRYQRQPYSKPDEEKFYNELYAIAGKYNQLTLDQALKTGLRKEYGPFEELRQRRCDDIYRVVVFSLAFNGKVNATNFLLNGVVRRGDDFWSACVMDAAGGYARANNPLQVQFAIKLFAPALGSAVFGYAEAGNQTEVDAILKKETWYTGKALRGYQSGGHEQLVQELLDRTVKSQFDKQKSRRNTYTLLVILAAIFLTPLSLLITLPLWFRAKNNEPIQELITSEEELTQVKEKRKTFRENAVIEKDNEKLKKVLLSEEGSKCTYLVDKGQLTRFKLFATHDVDYLKQHKAEIQDQIAKSKQESSVILNKLK